MEAVIEAIRDPENILLSGFEPEFREKIATALEAYIKENTPRVFLLWDNTPQIKGDPPALEGVFATKEAAEKQIESFVYDGYGEDPEDWGIEEREVKQ
jgi:hypothetical protein